jgi:hypothetical protein
MFLAQLQLVRLALCGGAVRLDGFVGAARQETRNRHRLWARSAKRLRAVLNAFGASSSHQKTDWS